MTDNSDNKYARCLYFDGTCPKCRRAVRRIQPLLNRKGIATAPFANGADEPEMRLTWSDGRVFGGASAAIFLTRQFWWSWPLFLTTLLPGVRPLLARVYRHIAANRHCQNGACSLDAPIGKPVDPGKSRLILGIAATPLLAACAIHASFPHLPGWAVMWNFAGALWLSFKGWQWLRSRDPINPLYFGWVGMDISPFERKNHTHRRDHTPWLPGFLSLAAGLGLILWLRAATLDAYLIGWLGMIGLILTLHFGLFHLMAAAWQRLGAQVAPIMQSPWKARSLSDFWGHRWNRAFSDVARLAIFFPAVRRFGPNGGILAGFLFSGLAHELVISLPAGAGYGLPTLYFAVQGLGHLAERRLFRPGSLPARLFLWAVVIVPAGLLFHPAFLERVITPMIRIATITIH